MNTRSLFLFFALMLVLGTDAYAQATPMSCMAIEHTDTLTLFVGEKNVGTLIQSSEVDSGTGHAMVHMLLTTEMGGGAVEVAVRKEYDTDGHLAAALESISSEAGANRWELVKGEGNSWRIRATIGGQVTERDAPPLAGDKIDRLCAVFNGIHNATLRPGDRMKDTVLDMMSARVSIEDIECISSPHTSENHLWELRITDSRTRYAERWLLDTLGRTMLRSISPGFEARRAGFTENGREKRTRKHTERPLTEMFRVAKSRAAHSDERIVIQFSDEATLHESVREMYTPLDKQWVLQPPMERCSVSTAVAGGTLADSASFRPTPILQSEHPRIRTLADSVAGNLRRPCEVIDALTRCVYSRLEKKNTATYSSALETLQAGFGDCGEHAVLLAALLRARGIPARVILGLVYMEGSKAYLGHAWVGVRSDSQWLFADASHGRFPAKDRLIPLIIDDEGTEMIDVLQYIDRITITYLPRL